VGTDYRIRVKFYCPHCNQYHLNIWFEREGVTKICREVTCRGCTKKFALVMNALECLYCTTRCKINSAGEYL
jgi:hypothetical protein